MVMLIGERLMYGRVCLYIEEGREGGWEGRRMMGYLLALGGINIMYCTFRGVE